MIKCHDQNRSIQDNLAGIVDEIVPSSGHETGPAVGEYFRYAVLKRMIEAADVMAAMKHLHSVLTIPDGARKPRRRIETPFEDPVRSPTRVQSCDRR